MTTETLEPPRVHAPETAFAVLHASPEMQGDIVASFQREGVDLLDLQGPRIAELWEQRAELLMMLAKDEIAEERERVIAEAMKSPANYLRCAVTLMVDELNERTVLTSAVMPDRVNTYATILPPRDEYGFRSTGPAVVMRLTEEPNDKGDLEARHVAVGADLLNNSNASGRYLFHASHNGDFRISIESWQNGEWRQTPVESEGEQCRLVQALALQLTEAYQAAEPAAHAEARRYTADMVRKQQHDLV